MAFSLWIDWSHVRKIYNGKRLKESSNRFDRNVALLDFSATIRNGITVVLGPKGSGKSSLLKITAAMLPPDDGRITYQLSDGMQFSWSQKHFSSHQSSDIETLRERIGYVPPLQKINHPITCEESLYYLGQLRRIPNLRRRCAEIIAKWGLAGYRKSLLRELPVHVLKRHLMAQSLLASPEIWILDDPTYGLDDLGRNLLIRALEDYRQKGRIVIIATKDMELAEIADDLILLEYGSCRRIGKKKYLTASVSEGTVAAWYQAMQVFSHLHHPVI